MKILRVLASGLLLVLAAIGVGLWYAVHHENQLVDVILKQVGKRSGLEIQPSNVRLGLGSRLVIVLEGARVIVNRHEIARLAAVRVVFSYWTLLHRTGLPLYALVLDGGTVSISRGSSETSIPQSAANRLETLSHYLDALTDVSRRFDLVEITLLAPDRRPLAEHVNGVAYRRHYRHGTWPWIANINAEISQGSIAGARFSADLQFGHAAVNQPLLAEGRVSFWDVPLRHIKLPDFGISTSVNGDVDLAVSVDAQATGHFSLTMNYLVAEGLADGTPLQLGSLWTRGDYHISQTRGELSNFELYHEKSPVLEGQATILNPYAATRAIMFSANGIAVELADTPKWLRSLHAVPPSVAHLAERIRSGTLMVSQVALKRPEPLKDLRLSKLARRLDISAALTRVSCVPPPELRLPPVYQLDAQLNYSGAVARITQASSQVGASSISDMTLDLDLSKAPDEIKYRLKLASWLDTGEAYDAANRFTQTAQPSLGRQLLWIHGHSPIQLRVKGTIEGVHPKIPQDYLITAGLGDVQFELKTMPAAIWLKGGSLALEPGRISFRRVIGIPLDQTGNVVVNGAILTQNRPALFRDFSLELHQIASDKWLPAIVNPNQISVFGPVGGKLVANSNPNHKLPTVVGKLTLDHGTVQPGFLRNPIIVTHSATLVLDGKGLILDLPASSLESEPLDFRMAVRDLTHPAIRIDANVSRIDFEVMRFIRLPWSPSTPPVFFPVPVAGHIDAQAGNFDKLALNRISTDFYHNSQAWRVNNFRASAFDGIIALAIAGRARDDWINMKGVIEHMDAGPLFLLSGNSREPPILGKLAASGDLWADTNTDFFRTLAGTVSITMTDGTLNRFTLMKRILSLVNLKNYLTAQFPDPRKSGVPFNTLDADFRGVGGNFYTDNLRLNGPVMDITARGNLDFANDTIDMEIDLLALQTVNWLINNIPLIGKHLSGATKHLVGAYFQVRGPTDHPAIWPKPLTSVAQFVLHTLTLPINIVAPNTIE